MLLKLLSSNNAEALSCAHLLLAELRKLIPSFVRRVDMPERGGVWVQYFKEIRDRIAATPAPPEQMQNSTAEVTLVDWDPDGEAKVIAAK